MKKNYLLYTACALAIASLNSCEDFLNKDPQDKQTNDTYWQTETSLRTYAQDFYSSYFKDTALTIPYSEAISLETTTQTTSST